MSIGIVNDDDFNQEMTRLISPSSDKFIPPEVKEIEHGRGNGNNAVPESLRKIIAEESLNGTKPDEIKSAFGVSASSTSAYKNGATSTASYNSPNSELIKHQDQIKLRINSRATNKILAAMRHITDDKLKHAKARDLAGIAKDMSAVVNNINPSSSPSAGAQNNFVFYAPRTKSDDEYEIIPVNR